MNTKHKGFAAVSAALVLAFVVSASAWTGGPSAVGGQNPLRTFAVDFSVVGVDNGKGTAIPASAVVKKTVFEVPKDQVFVFDATYTTQVPQTGPGVAAYKQSNCGLDAFWLTSGAGVVLSFNTTMAQGTHLQAGDKLIAVLRTGNYNLTSCPSGLAGTIVVSGHLMKQ